jgi:hypothetical protein
LPFVPVLPVSCVSGAWYHYGRAVPPSIQTPGGGKATFDEVWSSVVSETASEHVKKMIQSLLLWVSLSLERDVAGKKQKSVLICAVACVGNHL